MTRIDAEIGARLREHRIARGLSQDGLAKLVGLSRPAITLIEAGKQHLRVRDLGALARALHVPVVALLPEAWVPNG